MNTLISMVDFVLEYKSKIGFKSELERLAHYNNVYRNHARFLSKPLSLGMFVPCDEEGNVLEEPKEWKDYLKYPESFDGNKEWYELYKYEEAKERVLFEGFTPVTINGIQSAKMKNGASIYWYLVEFGKVESIANHNLELTPTAIKEIGIVSIKELKL